MNKLMNKLMTILLAALAGFTGVAHAQKAKELVSIIYAWGPGDSVANYSRTLVAEANKIQDKYTFIFDTRPGAGGAIATNYVLNNANTILAHSTAFFIRPHFYPNESYDISKLKTIMTHCMAPMSVTSSKYKSWSEVPTNKPITVGISGLGVTTHLAAVQLQKKYTNFVLVPFRATSDSLVSMVTGNTDLHIGFISEAEQWSKTNTASDRKVSVLGITGTKKIGTYTTLTSAGLGSIFNDMDVGFHLLMPKNVPDARVAEIQKILIQAQQAPTVHTAYAVDACAALVTNPEALGKWYTFHTNHWKKLTEGVELK